MRVGFGYDIHRLKVGRPCILGGVHIESPVALMVIPMRMFSFMR